MHNNYIFCLEWVKDVEKPVKSSILTSLENLALQYGITNVYATFDSIEGFEISLNNLVYEDKKFNDYQIIYLVLNGNNNEICIDNYYYSFEEIAEFFQGKFKDKIIHFANTFTFDLEEETFQYFLDVTGAKGLSGYVNSVPILSSVLDNLYFSLSEDADDVVELTELLFEKQYLLANSLGFRMYF